MLDLQAKQITLDPAGHLLWQRDATNPLPGAKVASLAKGDSVLKPVIAIDEAALPDGVNKEAAQLILDAWLAAYVAGVLEPLVALADVEKYASPVQQICARLFMALGILPREELEDQIALLDPEMRKVLREKKVKLGPVLVFLPDLNKPAAVRLRGLLWGIYNGKMLPVPADGIVSLKVESGADALFYRTIGYPVYGPRAVRIDMLDRVIVSVYDSAKEGKFQAKHEMAEWLGSPIEDLYLVLEAMGHRKIEEEKKIDAPVEEKTEEQKKEKPALAFFRLKKGRASQASSERPRRERTEHKSEPREKKDFKSKDRGPKKDYKKDHKKGRHEKREDRGPRVISAAAPKVNPEDNPFAILQQLKTKNDGSS
jgi:ATP-dependent RNA helicase SUPV3L1/SUV3